MEEQSKTEQNEQPTVVSIKHLEMNRASLYDMVVHALGGTGRRIRNLKVSSAPQALRQARLGHTSPCLKTKRREKRKRNK